MKKSDLEYFENLLNNRIQELIDHADNTVSGMTAPKENFPDVLNILVIHQLVTEERQHWMDLDTTQTANILLRKTKFDLIVAGDNHKTIFSSYGKRHLVNCGSLMRKGIDQAEHKPCVFIYDSVKKEISQHFIPIEPIEKVMNLEKAKEEKEKNLELDAFVDGLDKDVDEEGLIFPENLLNYIQNNNLEQGVIDFIEEATGCQIS